MVKVTKLNKHPYYVLIKLKINLKQGYYMQNLLFKIRKKIAQKLNLYNVIHQEIRTPEEFQEFSKKNKSVIELAQKLNQKLQNDKQKNSDSIYTFKHHLTKGLNFYLKRDFISSSHKGFCIYCDKEVNMKYDLSFEHYTNYKDTAFASLLSCPKCLFVNRSRTMLYVINKFINNRKNLTIYSLEKISPFYRALKKWYGKDFTIIGSEFLGDDIPSGSIINGTRHEDALNLSFDDNSLDFIVSNDVYEHVSNIQKTFKEAYRTLKSGGYMLFTIPFFPDNSITTTRAKIENNELVLLMEKEMHGNFLSEEGSLTFYNFGWDILNLQKDAGFKDPYIIGILDEKFGHINYSPLLVFVARK